MKIRVIDLIVILIIIIGLIIGIIVFGKGIYKLQYKNRIAELTKDNIEIEKKYLIDKNNIEYDLSNAKIYDIEQTYICFSPEMRVRKVNNGNQYSFTLKRNLRNDGLTRDEIDFLITEDEYNKLVVKKEGNTIFKTRYKIFVNGQVVAIDIFKGDLEGLAYMEIEFASIEEADKFVAPNWVLKDVTDDIRYKNAYLSKYGIPEEN